jgi:hypothetical protein
LPASGGRSAGIVRWQTQATEFSFSFFIFAEYAILMVWSLSKLHFVVGLEVQYTRVYMNRVFMNKSVAYVLRYVIKLKHPHFFPYVMFRAHFSTFDLSREQVYVLERF